MMKIIINFVEKSPFCTVTYQNVSNPYRFATLSYEPYTKLNYEDYHQFCRKITIFHSNLPSPKNVSTPYRFATLSYDPYTNFNDEDHHQFF